MGEVTRMRDLPYEMFCAYQDKWTTPSSTISFDSFLADYNNGDRPGGGQGEMDLATGTFTCLTGGYYTISFAAYHLLHLKESTNLFLYHNGERLAASSGWQSNDNSAGAALAIQGGRTLILHLAVGDTLSLGVTACSGAINQLTFCLSLTGFDYAVNSSS